MQGWVGGRERKVKARHRTLLTVTPLQSNPGELFMLLHFLRPDRRVAVHREVVWTGTRLRCGGGREGGRETYLLF